MAPEQSYGQNTSRSSSAAQEEPTVERQRAGSQGQRSRQYSDTPVTTKRLSASKSQPQLRLTTANGKDKEEDSWVAPTSRATDLGQKATPNKNGRVWLQPSDSNEEIGYSWTASRTIADSGYVQSPVDYSTMNASHTAPTDSAGPSRAPSMPADSNDHLFEPSPADWETAKKIYLDEGDSAKKGKAATLLGQAGTASERLREAYLCLYDFGGISILSALRELCGRLVLKAETQQVDRILASFSQRWCDCNPRHGFKNTDVVHTICYSLLLLNTDLYLADMDSKMTKTQFLKNTLPTIKRVAGEASFEIEASVRMSSRTSVRGALPWRDVRSPSPASPAGEHRPSVDVRDTESRLSVRHPLTRTNSDNTSQNNSPTPYESRSAESVTLLVNSGSEKTTLRLWEAQIEGVLKEFYNSIRQQRLPLHNPQPEVNIHGQPSNNNLSVKSATIGRSGSVLSKAPSENMPSRPSTSDHRANTTGSNRWNTRNRSRNRPYHSSTQGSSSRTSFEEQSLWSPTASSTWSKSHYAKTLPSMSSDSLASHLTHGGDHGFHQSIGFANALSHAIIREEASQSLEHVDSQEGMSSDVANTPLLEDETLGLAGAPWAKEGIVQHKHHLETTDKKAKDRNWSECFVVVEKGWMRLFSFSSKASIKSQKKAQALRGGAGVVGGGNWTESAEAIGSFMLRQTIANALPPPGYSKQRPFVFALSLPNGAVHLFQVGTLSIAQEFVSAANYWSARLSKEPLVGGVSNIEYGWSESLLSTADSASHNLTSDPNLIGRSLTTPSPSMNTSTTASPITPTITTTTLVAHGRHRSATSVSGHSRSYSRPSFQGSVRSSIEGAASSVVGLPTTATLMLRPKLAGDRANISDWSPPTQSMLPSNLPEAKQLEALRKYVLDVETELSTHNELRAQVLRAFSPRHPNATRAMGNWERKSSYLLREIVKYGTYVDSLMAARAAADRIRDEREDRAREKQTLKREAEEREERERELVRGEGMGVPREMKAAILSVSRGVSPA